MPEEESQEDRGYRRQRERAQGEKIMNSMNRKLGYFTPLDVGSLPRKTITDYDPRKK